MQPFIQGKLPHNMKRARPLNKELRTIVASKLTKYLERGYCKIVHQSYVQNYIDYFPVPKGKDDIRMVFNGYSCGLNKQVWAPSFWLTTSATMMRSFSFNYKFVDMDLGEMLLNFSLHRALIPYSGIDLSPLVNELRSTVPQLIPSQDQLGSSRLSAVWLRTWMGFKPSPYWAVCYYYLAEEFCRGNQKDKTNPLLGLSGS